MNTQVHLKPVSSKTKVLKKSFRATLPLFQKGGKDK